MLDQNHIVTLTNADLLAMAISGAHTKSHEMQLFHVKPGNSVLKKVLSFFRNVKKKT